MVTFLEPMDFTEKIHFKAFQNYGLNIIGPHCHGPVEIIYAKKGTVNIGLDNSLIELKEDEIVYFYPGQLHYFLTSPDSVRYVYLIDLGIFPEVNLREAASLSIIELLEKREQWSRDWPEKLSKEVKFILNELYRKANNEIRTFDNCENYFIMGMLNLLIGAFYQDLPLTTKEKPLALVNKYQESLSQLNKVMEYVQDHYQEEIRLKDVADSIGFNQYYFTKFFKKITSKTFFSFLESYRVQQACFILAKEKIPVTEVAEKAGFGSIKTFHHVFKKRIGLSPLQYQKQYYRENPLGEKTSVKSGLNASS